MNCSPRKGVQHCHFLLLDMEDKLTVKIFKRVGFLKVNLRSNNPKTFPISTTKRFTEGQGKNYGKIP